MFRIPAAECAKSLISNQNRRNVTRTLLKVRLASSLTQPKWHRFAPADGSSSLRCSNRAILRVSGSRAVSACALTRAKGRQMDGRTDHANNGSERPPLFPLPFLNIRQFYPLHHLPNRVFVCVDLLLPCATVMPIFDGAELETLKIN